MRQLLAILCALLANSALAADPATIPQKEIWAFRMPGTRPMRAGMNQPPGGGPLQHASEESPLVEEIRRALQPRLTNGKREHAERGFAVVGRDMDALRAAHRVLVDNGKRQHSFTANERITLVFFTYDFGSYVELDRVVVANKQIDIFYRLVPHRSAETTQHIALIPVDGLTPGRYHVRPSRILERGGKEEIVKPDHWDDEFISRPFTFSIVDRVNDEGHGGWHA